MLRIWISLLAVGILSAWATGAASAQLAQEISFTDAALDAFPPPANAYADIVAGSIGLADETTLRLTLRIGALPPAHPGLGYGIVFSDGERDWYGAAVTIPDLLFYVGEWDGDSPGTGVETSGVFTPGVDGVVEIAFPLGMIPNATHVSQPRALVVDIKGDILPVSAGFIVLDEARGEGELALPGREDPVMEQPEPDPVEAAALAQDAPPASPAEPSPRASVPGAPLAALGALALAARRRRANRLS